jgi:Fe2+ or Zn2+ uptake regulation protein
MDTTHDDPAQSARLDAALTRIRALGMRRTVARGAVLKAILATEHQSVSQIHDRISGQGIAVDLSTVHRIVDALVDIGLLHVLPTTTATTYGFADAPHHHSVCAHCGRIQELPAAQVAPALRLLEPAARHCVDPNDPNAGIVIYGRCHACIAAER